MKRRKKIIGLLTPYISWKWDVSSSFLSYCNHFRWAWGLIFRSLPPTRVWVWQVCWPWPQIWTMPNWLINYSLLYVTQFKVHTLQCRGLFCLYFEYSLWTTLGCIKRPSARNSWAGDQEKQCQCFKNHRELELGCPTSWEKQQCFQSDLR